jgi:uncharacterized repeat protein (TIGR01451 family)
MNKPITIATSTLFFLMSGLAAQSQATSKQEFSLATLQAVTDVKKLESVERNTEKVFIPQKGMQGEQNYIIRFSDEPLTSYEGSIKGLNTTAITTKKGVTLKGNMLSSGKLDVKSQDSEAYLNHLDKAQSRMGKVMVKRLARSLPIQKRFKIALNGVAVTMTQEEAQQLSTLSGIAKIEIDRIDYPSTDRGPTYVGAPELWAGNVNAIEAKGEGFVLGILDSGINGDHPSFAATGGDGFVHTNPLGSGNFLGECDPANVNFNPAVSCNDKLIGRFLFSPTADEDTSEDTDGHGSHVASTAGGNFIQAPVFDAEGNPTGLDLDISGVAPHANIIAFQVCAPGCSASARVGAVEQAIADGVVDVLNHSIGSRTPVTINPWTDAVDLAFLAARAAGITVVNSIGNNGPDPSTLGSSGAPWLTNVANYSHDREIADKFIDEFTGGDTTAPGLLSGGGITAGIEMAPIVFAGDFSNGDADPEQCLTAFSEGTWTNGEIVVCDRGAIARTQKCANVRDGGAAGCVLANIDGGASSVSNDAHVIPAIHVAAAAGNEIKAWLASGTDHTATISDSLKPFGSNPALGSIASGSTSRGPHLGQDYLPVSLGAPGTDIYAALADGTEFGFLSGTSMASPHVAGASILMKQVQPTWTDAEILSALATTAGTVTFKEDGVTPSVPFDVGGGMMRVDLAAQAGLLMDETVANFEAANPSLGGDPKALNVAAMVTRNCVINCTWVRTVEATADGSWTVTSSDPSITVSPSTFDLIAGATQSLVVSVDANGFANGEWVHGQVTMTPTADMPVQHLTVSFTPSTGELPEELVITTTRDADSFVVSGLEAKEISDLQLTIGGLTAPTATALNLAGDSDNSSSFDDLTDGIFFTLITVPAGATRLVASTSDAQSDSPDVDLRVGIDLNGDGMPNADELVCTSATATAEEICDVRDLESGEWWVMVQNWQASGTPPDSVVLNTSLVNGDNGNMTLDAPSAVTQLTPFDLRVLWTLPESAEGDIYYGTVTLGSDAANPDDIGTIPVTITRGANDVSYQVSSLSATVGDTLTYTVEVATNNNPEDRNYSIETTIPDGFSLVADSVTGDAVVSGNSISWSVSQESTVGAQLFYTMTTSNEDPACAVPFANSGGYTDLEAFGIAPGALVEGNTQTFSAFSGQNFNFYGKQFVGGFNFTDDGFVFFDSTAGTTPWVHTPVPFNSDPNDMIAILWRDMVIPSPNTTPGSFVGVSLASAGSNLSIIEYDNMQLFGSGSDSIDFQMAITGAVNDATGAYEIMMAFDNIDVDSTAGTIGVENANATAGTQYTFNGVDVTNGMAICYDLVGPVFETVVLTYEVTVDEAAEGTRVVSELSNTVDSIGSQVVTISETVNVAIAGDWDLDGDVDINDVRGLIRAIQKNQAINMAFDLNDDGAVNIRDARAMMSLCSRTRCAAEPVVQ